jgi:hypothetical protein
MAALLMLALHLTGCMTWKPVTVSPRQLIEEQQPERIRLVQADGRQLDLIDPRLDGDTITAPDRSLRKHTRSGLRYDTTVRIALTDVTAVETRGYSATGVAIGVVITPAAIFFVVRMTVMNPRWGLTF